MQKFLLATFPSNLHSVVFFVKQVNDYIWKWAARLAIQVVQDRNTKYSTYSTIRVLP